MTPPNKYSKPLVTGPKEMEIQELPDQEFKNISLKNAKRTHINNLKTSGKQHKNKKKFKKEIDNLKKIQTIFGAEEYN